MLPYFELTNKDSVGSVITDIGILYRTRKNVVDITIGDKYTAQTFEADSEQIEQIIEALIKAKEMIV